MTTVEPLPGVVVDVTAGQASFGDPTDPAVLFLVGVTGRGPTTPVECRSLQAVNAVFGDRADGPLFIDSADLHFRRNAGLTPRVIGLRRVGAAAAAAALTLQDSDPADAVTFTARQVGEFANGATGGYKIAVAAGTDSGSKVTVLENDIEVEVYDNLADQDALLAAFATSPRLTAADAGSGELPANTAATSLTGGTDDRADVADDRLEDDLALLPASLGIGQIILPGVGTTAAHQLLADHAEATGRYAIGDIPAGSTEAQARTLRQAIKDRPSARSIELAYSDSVTLPPAVPGGASRSVPASAAIAAVMARSIRRNGHPIIAAAGDHGTIPEAIGVADPLTPAEWTDLYADHVNPIVVDNRTGTPVVKVYGIRTASADGRWKWNTDVRTANLLRAQLQAAGEPFLFGEPTTSAKIERFRGACLAVMDRHAALGAFEESAGYDFDVSVNTPSTITAGQLLGEAVYTPPGQTEQVRIGIFAQARLAA